MLDLAELKLNAEAVLAWAKRDLRCGCERYESCARCWPPEFREGGRFEHASTDLRITADMVLRLLAIAAAAANLQSAYERADDHKTCSLTEAAQIVRDATAALREALDTEGRNG